MPARKFIRDMVGFAASQYMARLLLTVRGLIAARLLGPGGYGDWNAIMLILDYGTHAPLGTYQGLDQAVPARIVDGDARRLDGLKRAGLFNVLVSSALFVTFCMLYFARTHGQLREAWGLGGVAVVLACVVLTTFSFYHLTLLRSHGNFTAVSIWFVLQSVIGVVLGLALIPWLGVWGLLWGWIAGTLAATLMVTWSGRAVVPRVPVPSRDSLALLRTGSPMFVHAASSFVLRSLDRVLIFKFLGPESLGLYGLAVMALGFLLTLPDAISYVLYPKLVRRFRESGDRPEAIRDHVHRMVRVLSLLVPALCAIAYIGADDAVEWLLPRFRDGVPALRMLCFSAAGLSLANLGSIVLMTLGRQRVLVPVAAATIATGVALDLIAIHSGHGIRGVAWATFVTFSLHSAVLVALAETGMGGRGRARLAFLSRSFLPLLIAMPLAWLFERFLPGNGPPGWVRAFRFFGSVAGWLVLYAAATLWLARGIGLRRLLRELEWPWSGYGRGGGTSRE